MRTVADLRKEYQEIQDRLADSKGIDGKEIAALATRASELESVLELANHADRLAETLADLRTILDTEQDRDLRAVAESELPDTERRYADTSKKLRAALLPHDPASEKDIVMEIRAGAGGDEASLFARDLFSMYGRYAEQQGWAVQLISESRSDIGGYKEVIFEIAGSNVYSSLKYERGVHRIQRIPETEKSGRIHTSTASVAVLPKAEPIDMEIRPEDLRIDTFRAGGHGGQKVQKTESAIRITHIPTGIIVQCQDERSQQQNRERALVVLRTRLLAHQTEKQQQQAADTRRVQIGTGDRSEKIRTYNIPQDRITDHRIKKTWHGVEHVFAGGLDEIIAALREEEERRLLDTAT